MRYAHTEPAFVYTDAQGRVGVCKLQIAPLAHATVVVATELRANRGPSVTNAFEQLVAQVVDKFELDWLEVFWVEHYESKPHEWHLVTWVLDLGRVYEPCWRDMTVFDWMELGLHREEFLKDE